MKAYDKLIWRHRVICCYHGLSAMAFSFYWHFTQFDITCSKGITDLELAMGVNTSMHLLMDLLFMKYNGFLDTGNLIHHIFGILGYLSCSYLQFNFGFLAYHLLPAEISNVQMNMREILKRIGWRYTKSYYFNEYQYFILYFCARTMWIPSCYYFMFMCETINPITAIIFPLHILMNYYYASHIPKMAKQRYDEYNKITNSGFNFSWTQPIDQAALDKLGIRSYEAYKT